MKSDTSKSVYPITPMDKSGQCAPTHFGITLREYYAGLSMQGLLQNGLYGPCVAIEAVEYADALIAALQGA